MAVLLAAASVLLFTARGSATATFVVTGSPSGFESGDGNMVLNTLGRTNTDWNCFGFTSSVSPPSDCSVMANPEAVHVTADAAGEISWVSGQKFDTLCPALQVGNNPPKDEFTDVASYDESTTTAPYNLYFYGATIRSTANGNASGDVEFNQNSGNGTTTAGCRTAGDKLLAYDYLNGGTSLNFHVLTWIDSTHSTLGGNSGTCFVKTNSPPCWGANVITPDGTLFNGQSNQAPILAADNGISATALATNQFAEFGINLTQALGLTGCISYPQEVWESRSSGSSFTSNPADIEIEHHVIQNCGQIKIIKQTDPRGQDQVFSYTSNLPANAQAGGVKSLPCNALGIASNGNFCLNDTKNTTSDSAQNTVNATNVPPGPYWVTEGTEPSSFSLKSLNCTTDITSGSSAMISTMTASITLKPHGVVTCTYVNQLHSGAILITKTGKNKNCTGLGTPPTSGGVVCTGAATADLGGATFKVTTDAAGNNQVAGSPITTSAATGTACLDGLNWATGGTSYYVTETAAPTGYALDQTAASTVTVNQNAKCGDSTIAAAAPATFTDTPLTDVSVNVKAEAAGATQSSISCVVSGTNTAIGNSPQPATGQGDPETLLAPGLKPGNYTCTVVIDP